MALIMPRATQQSACSYMPEPEVKRGEITAVPQQM